LNHSRYGRTQFSAVPAIKKKEKQAGETPPLLHPFLFFLCFAVVTEEQYRKVLNESPHYVDAYKSLLREKEAQIKDLTTKLRSLLGKR
jgi:hypothetical protein